MIDTNSVDTMYRVYMKSKGVKVKKVISKKNREMVFFIRNKPRRISVPSDELKKEQRRILDEELASIPVHECAYGFIKGRDLFDNASIHQGSHGILEMDMRNFFDTITREQVYKALVDNYMDREKASYIATVCTRHGLLPQGAPTSPTLSNIVAKKMDGELYRLCQEKSLKYTRYADDITISGDFNILLTVKSAVQSIINRHGFTINQSKTHTLTRNRQQNVTGVVVNAGINAPKKDIRAFRSLLYHIRKSISEGTITTLDELKSRYDSWEALIGYANFIYSANPNKKVYVDQVHEIRSILVKKSS